MFTSFAVESKGISTMTEPTNLHKPPVIDAQVIDTQLVIDGQVIDGHIGLAYLVAVVKRAPAHQVRRGLALHRAGKLHGQGLLAYIRGDVPTNAPEWEDLSRAEQHAIAAELFGSMPLAPVEPDGSGQERA